MNDIQENPKVVEELPSAKVRRTKWTVPVIWVVPLVAAVVAGYLVFDRVREYGTTITIRFKDVSGLKTGRTPIKYRGVNIGEVTDVELSEDRRQVLVKARLRRSGASVAREGTSFWIVRPEVAAGSVTGLGTVISGPEIGVLPGSGKAKSEFVGLESSPVVLERNVLKIVLLSGNVSSLRPGTSIYYRGVEVGAVHDIRLGRNARAVELRAYIKRRYANLVREDSMFWNVSGVDVNFGLLRGLEVNMESLRSLVLGGIAFATPPGPKAASPKDGMLFRLYEKPEQAWLDWSPDIPIAPESEI
ncbi:MAG: MlaD family protein [Sulfuricella sp.]|nr:MlaD family protein [Sulfuricella sp.]